MRELDEDADGFILKAEFIEFMKGCGEPFSEDEMNKMIDIACEKDSDMPHLIDIRRLAAILLPEIKTENQMTMAAAGGDYKSKKTAILH